MYNNKHNQKELPMDLYVHGWAVCVCVLCVSASSVPQLIYGGKLDFLVFDYLSEITMSLLTAAKAKMPVSSSFLGRVHLCARIRNVASPCRVLSAI